MTGWMYLVWGWKQTWAIIHLSLIFAGGEIDHDRCSASSGGTKTLFSSCFGGWGRKEKYLPPLLKLPSNSIQSIHPVYKMPASIVPYTNEALSKRELSAVATHVQTAWDYEDGKEQKRGKKLTAFSPFGASKRGENPISYVLHVIRNLGKIFSFCPTAKTTYGQPEILSEWERECVKGSHAIDPNHTFSLNE